MQTKLEKIIQENDIETWIDNGVRYFKCIVCQSPVADYDICERCGWQNTGPAHQEGGPNHISIDEAIDNYINFGTVNPK